MLVSDLKRGDKFKCPFLSNHKVYMVTKVSASEVDCVCINDGVTLGFGSKVEVVPVNVELVVEVK